MPPAAAVPPSPAQHATEDSNTSRLLQVLDRQRENLDRMATTARANTAASRENTAAIFPEDDVLGKQC